MAGRNRGSFLALGLVFFVLGTTGLAVASLLRPDEILYAGMLLLAGGGAQMANAMVVNRCSRCPPRQIADALLYLTAGLTIAFSPALASRPAIFVVGGSLVGIGASRILTARRYRGILNWEWILIGGIAAILLGIALGAGWPVAGSHAVGLVLSSELIFNAWSWLILAQAFRNRKSPHGQRDHAVDKP